MQEEKMIGDNNWPKYGWKVKLNHTFPERRTQDFRPKIRQLIPIIPLIFRYIYYTIKCWLCGEEPVMDYLKTVTGKQIYGVPIGGIGCGTIGRGFHGEFCRYQMKPGIYEYNIIPANQFIVTIREKQKTVYQQVLSSVSKPRRGLSSWKWAFPGWNAKYCALYPRSWTCYSIPEHNVTLVCRQVSPVIPHNYKDSSVPGAAFIWSVENEGKEEKDISISFTFKNGTGSGEDKKGECWNEIFTESDVTGVKLHQTFSDMPCTYAIGAKMQNGVSVSVMTDFDPCSDGSSLWEDLFDDGELDAGSKKSDKTKKGQQIAAAVCAKVHVPPGQVCSTEMALVWDMPKIHFHGKAREYKKFYTKYFGDSGSGDHLCKYVLDKYKDWEEEIEEWQNPILDDVSLPDWYKSAIFNETYFISDGGGIWLLPWESLPSSDPRSEYGHFAYLEGQEYRMYNTYDVHFYASFALAKLWPRLQEVLQYDIMDTIVKEDKTKRWQLYDGSVTYRKVKDSVPHDIGEPYEEPFLLLNGYPIHDVSEWRDLNLKFVLQCYRDWKLFDRRQYIEDMWPKIDMVMHKSMAWDKDHDGLIENGGSPDQTYDSWVMTGPSAYCGSLWLAALYCSQKIAEELGYSDTAMEYSDLLKKARSSFEEKLWNGEYYNFDCALNYGSRTIMADQLCGLWYLRASNVKDEVFIDVRVKQALKKIFDFNVQKFRGGAMGAVNGMTPDGQVDFTTVQSEEVWTGVTYGLSALMLHEGMVDEGLQTAHGVYNTVYNVIGMGFDTPEALYAEKWYRAVAYMRPLSIWSIQHAWEMGKEKQLVQESCN